MRKIRDSQQPSMNTTIDNKLVSNMLGINAQSAPEFLHCGSWPSHPPSDSSDGAVEACFLVVSDNKVEGKVHERSMKWPPSMFQWLKCADQGQSPRRDESRPLTAEDVSDSVDAWKVSLDEWKDEHNSVTVPYSALSLLGKRVVNDRQPYSADRADQSPQTLFEREILAECQARKEITDYIEKLDDAAESEEAFECVWPLEEYRRQGWAKELLSAFPGQCKEFVDAVLTRREKRSARPYKKGRQRY